MECERAARILAKRTCDSSGLAFCNRSRLVRGLTRFSVCKLSLGKIADRKMGLTPYKIAIHVTTVNTYGIFT